MNQTSYNRPARATRQNNRPESKGVYRRRQAVALGVVAVLAVPGSKIIPAEYRAITGTTVADRLAKPFDQAKAELDAGKFSPGSVREVSLPAVDQSAYEDALVLTGRNASESNIDEVYTDISAQQGDTPPASSPPVIVPTGDLRPGLQK
jgi:hypothetical protein